jgi:excinuclease ABC subunit A
MRGLPRSALVEGQPPLPDRSKTVAEIYALDVSRALELFRGLPRPKENPLTAMLADEIANRLDYLERVGLSYLTLDRQSRTLSGGEVQRVDLTTALGSSLVGTLYVLDEPSIGLHPRDTGRLMEVLKKLRFRQHHRGGGRLEVIGAATR